MSFISVKEAVRGSLQGRKALQSVFSRVFEGALKEPPNGFQLKRFQGHYKEGAIREVLQGAFQGALHGQLHICTKLCLYLTKIRTHISSKSRQNFSHMNLGRI